MDKLDGLSVLVLVLLLSFAIDRVVQATSFLLEYPGAWRDRIDVRLGARLPVDPDRVERSKTLFYYAWAGFLAFCVLAVYADIRVLQALGFETQRFFDRMATGVVLMSGSDLVGRLLQISGLRSGASSSPEPLEIRGKLVLESRDDRGGG